MHWRYAPVSVNYDLVYVDPLTGWGDWIDEYYTVYPDGTCARKITARSSSPFPVPGQGPGAGETHTYSWVNEAPGSKADFDNYTLDLLHKISDLDPSQHKWLMQPKPTFRW